MKIKDILLWSVLVCPMLADAAAPDGYYAACEGLTGKELIEALSATIFDHKQVGYNGLWALYAKSDVREDGTIWDMYSTKHWTYQKDQCGNYSSVGDCYNREHSMPKSWFNDQLPMYCDAFHIYPTDGKVNGQRGNYPYGECANGTTLASHGGVDALGKLGKSTFPGYSGTVFEPVDEYKGDFARSYFYMAACYNHLIEDWNCEMLANNSYPAFTDWAVNLLLKWHRLDPVSQKEIDRNEVIYDAQKNRNPFIDYPELAEYVWGDKVGKAWTTEANQSPIIQLIYESPVELEAEVSKPSTAWEFIIDAENVTSDITVAVRNPFEVSINKANWNQQITLNPEEERFYLRLNGDTPGEYYTSIVLSSGDYTNDEAVAEGVIRADSGINAVKKDGKNAWTAFCRDGSLVIETDCVQKAKVYGVDGIVYFDGKVRAGLTPMPLESGIYVVAINGYTRKVVVK